MSDIYTVGGSVNGRTRAYVERAADQEFLQLCLAGELGYLLTSRQMGKSSMMVHTVRRLNQRSVRTVSITLEQIGTSGVTPEQWYLGLLGEIEEQLDLDTEALAFWEEHSHLSYPSGSRATWKAWPCPRHENGSSSSSMKSIPP